MKKPYLILLMALYSISFSLYSQTNEEKGLQVAQTADLKDVGWKSVSMQFTMTLKNKHGQETTRSLHSEMLEVENDGDKSVVVFDTPPDVKGTTSLTYSHKTESDDQWLYLPALNRVKRISSNNKSGPFMGSEFAYEDISSQEVEKFTYKFIENSNANGYPCVLVERYPVDKNSGYTKQKTWFNLENYRIEKIDYYDRKNELLKTLEFLDYKLYKGVFWRADIMHMVNRQNGKQTDLKFSNYAFGIDVNEKNFVPAYLKNVR